MKISDLVRDIKSSSSNFINSQNWVKGKFSWQEGYGIFSYSHSHLDKIYRYIQDQEIHHAKFTFKREYLELLKKFDIAFEEKYVFDFYWPILKSSSLRLIELMQFIENQLGP